MNVVVNGLMTNYQKSGQGRVLVLLHGWGDSSSTFSKLTPELKDNYQIFALDLPGFGGTQTPPEAWGVDDYAGFVSDWISKLGIEPYALAGHSFGGAVALELAPKLKNLKKLILLASAGVRNKNQARKTALRAAAKTGKLPLYLLTLSKRRAVKQKFYGSIGSDAMLLPHMEETYRRIIDEDSRAAAAKATTPTLLIYGDKDKSTPAKDGLALHRVMDGSELKVVNAGHFLHQEDAGEVAGLIQQFLDGKANV